jgi:DNA-binding transcriptional MerR regulator
MTKPTRDSFSSRQVAFISGLSMAMVDYLCRHGIVTPSGGGGRGRGTARQYNFSDLVILKVVVEMLRAGLSVARLKKSLIALRKQHVDLSTRVPPIGLLVTDGRTVYLKRAGDSLEDLLVGQMAFAFVLELDSIHNELTSKAARSMSRAKSRHIRKSA